MVQNGSNDERRRAEETLLVHLEANWTLKPILAILLCCVGTFLGHLQSWSGLHLHPLQSSHCLGLHPLQPGLNSAMKLRWESPPTSSY